MGVPLKALFGGSQQQGAKTFGGGGSLIIFLPSCQGQFYMCVQGTDGEWLRCVKVIIVNNSLGNIVLNFHAN